jgi:hypothetical protein
MAALTAGRVTNWQDGEVVVVPVAASTTIYEGGMVAVNSSGDARPAADAAGLKVIGRAEEYVVNAGSAGAKTIKVRRKKAFWWVNDGTNAVTKAHLHGLATIYVKDDQTVASAGGTNSIVAGRGLAVDATLGVLVETP